MSQFFQDLKSFRRDLRARADSDGQCWACSSRDTPLAQVSVRRDFKTLNVPARGCQRQITLCPECAVQYMNSFNIKAHQRLGGRQPDLWDVETLLGCFYGRAAGEIEVTCSHECPFWGQQHDNVSWCKCECGRTEFVCGFCLEAGRVPYCSRCANRELAQLN